MIGEPLPPIKNPVFVIHLYCHDICDKKYQRMFHLPETTYELWYMKSHRNRESDISCTSVCHLLFLDNSFGKEKILLSIVFRLVVATVYDFRHCYRQSLNRHQVFLFREFFRHLFCHLCSDSCILSRIDLGMDCVKL